MTRPGQGTFLKYLAVQIPGWLLLVGTLLVMRTWVAIPDWAIGALFGLAVLKDLALYPFLRNAYRGDPRTGGERLVGSRGSVATALTPGGYVFVRGELWQAEVHSVHGTVAEGTTVRILGASGLTLTVEPDGNRRSERQ